MTKEFTIFLTGFFIGVLSTLIIGSAAHADPYASVAWNEVDHDNQGYVIDGEDSTLLSFGYRTKSKVFLFGEVTVSGTSSGSGYAVGIGVNMKGVELSAGVGQSKEEAVTVSNGVFTDSSDDKYEYEFIEVGYNNMYLRISEYNVNYNFENVSFADDRTAVQLGYRLFF